MLTIADIFEALTAAEPALQGRRPRLPRALVILESEVKGGANAT